MTEEKGALTRLEQEGEIAADYLEELLDISDLDGDLDIDVENGRSAVQAKTGERSRLMLDVADFRKGIKESLQRQAAEVIERAKETGEQQSMVPMNPFERKVVHDAVKAAGLTSNSEGVEPSRYVVIIPSGA